MDYVVTGANLAGAISLRRDSAVGAIKKALELICRDVQVPAPDGRVYRHQDFDSLAETRSDSPRSQRREGARRRDRQRFSNATKTRGGLRRR
jgi:hypothetical protein